MTATLIIFGIMCGENKTLQLHQYKKGIKWKKPGSNDGRCCESPTLSGLTSAIPRARR